MHPNIENKVAVVTGGSRGIGFRIAEMLLENGASVVICSREETGLRRATETLGKTAGARIEGMVADISQYSQAEKLMARAEERFGGVDILVNNAGVGIFRSIEQLTPMEWDLVIGTNLTGVFYCTHAAIGLMKHRGGGYIFNISSLAGKNTFGGGAAYNASKFGLNGLSEAMMLDLRYDNIRVSQIMPGSVETSFGRSWPRGPRSASSGWKLAAEDVAQVVLDLLRSDPRAMLSRVEMRPSKPSRK